jgi:hypothetical protein
MIIGVGRFHAVPTNASPYHPRLHRAVASLLVRMPDTNASRTRAELRERFIERSTNPSKDCQKNGHHDRQQQHRGDGHINAHAWTFDADVSR